jgi:DNA-binding XRE family transcriptional regulator
VIHRHLDVPPGTPVAKLPVAALHDLLDRGDLDDWRPILVAIEREPHGEIASRVARLVDAYPMYGTSPLLRAWIERCRQHRADRDPRAGFLPDGHPVPLARLRRELGRTQSEVARELGISQSDYSKLERRRDLLLSTLQAVAHALGGRLHLVVSLQGRVTEISVESPKDSR